MIAISETTYSDNFILFKITGPIGKTAENVVVNSKTFGDIPTDDIYFDEPKYVTVEGKDLEYWTQAMIDDLTVTAKIDGEIHVSNVYSTNFFPKSAYIIKNTGMTLNGDRKSLKAVNAGPEPVRILCRVSASICQIYYDNASQALSWTAGDNDKYIDYDFGIIQPGGSVYPSWNSRKLPQYSTWLWEGFIVDFWTGDRERPSVLTQYSTTYTNRI